MSESLVDESRWSEPTEIALAVLDEFRALGHPLESLLVLFDELVRHILVSEFEDMFTVTTNTTTRTAKAIELTFHDDLFRKRLADAANKRLGTHVSSY